MDSQQKHQRMFWFLDSIMSKIPPDRQGTVDVLARTFVSLIGHPDLEHVIVNPEACTQNLFRELCNHNFSVVIDLSGFLSEAVRKSFPGIHIVDELHISRLRSVSSPKLDGCGFQVNLTQDQIQKLKDGKDLSCPLILDDVGWSGRTMIEACRLLDIHPSHSTFGFLTVNVGNFGEGKPGAAQLLREKGAKVISGSSVETPSDDGFHLIDFIPRSEITPATFSLIVQVQQLRERAATADRETKKLLVGEIGNLLVANKSTLFPSSLDWEQVVTMQKEGRWSGDGGLNPKAFFDTNPSAWLVPSFATRVRSDMLAGSQIEIVATLQRLQDIIDKDREPREESAELKNGFGLASKERFL